MPIPVQPPAQPPAQPPVQVVEKPVYVERPVYIPGQPTGSAQDLKAESNSSNASKSQSDSSSVNSASQQNVQINNNSNRVEVDGIKIPTTTLNLNGYYNDGSYNNDSGWGVVVGISTSLDGKSRANKMLEKRIKITQLQYERELAGACASIDKDGYVVNPDSPIATELAQCSNVIRARKKVEQVAHVPAPRPVVNTEIQQLRAENAELRQQLALILQKLDNNNKPVNGGF